MSGKAIPQKMLIFDDLEWSFPHKQRDIQKSLETKTHMEEVSIKKIYPWHNELMTFLLFDTVVSYIIFDDATISLTLYS